MKFGCGDYNIITNNSGVITIKDTRGIKSDIYTFFGSTIYKLQRKRYTFTEAFKAYEEGKEIESYVSGERFGKEIACFDSIDIADISGEWYINN